MLVSRKLRKLDKVLEAFPDIKHVHLIARAPEHEILRTLGFSAPFQPGEHGLPTADFGPSCRRNSNGYDIVRRDLPKETRTRQISWRRKELHGRDVVEKEGIVDRPYLRYPREQVPAFSQELTAYFSATGGELVTSGPFELHVDTIKPTVLNTIRMYVEIFGSCEIVCDLNVGNSAPQRRQLNWIILPPGRRPWEESASEIGKALRRLSTSSQIVVKDRFESIHRYTPDFTAYGQHGFNRYVVYGWERAKLYILESTEVDNATYVLKHDWERLSQLSKAEVLFSDESHIRLIHHKGWLGDLGQLMTKHGISPP